VAILRNTFIATGQRSFKSGFLLDADSWPAEPLGQSCGASKSDNGKCHKNQDETVLAPAGVASSQFEIIAPAALDEQVDAEPLVVTNQKIVGKGAFIDGGASHHRFQLVAEADQAHEGDSKAL